MKRYWIDLQYFNNELVKIKGDDFHHICEVCRLQKGEHFEVLNGDGKAYLVELTELKKNEATAVIKQSREVPPIAKPYVHLCVSIPKFSTFDTILEKSVELGAKHFRPFVSDYSFVRSENSEKLQNKHERWERIIKSATQQCGRAEFMDLDPVCSLEKLLRKFNQTPNAVGLFPYEGEASLTMKKAVQEVLKSKPDSIWVFIGSEGGFSQKEVQLFQSVNLQPATLGDQVLRVETACLSMLSILRYDIGM